MDSVMKRFFYSFIHKKQDYLKRSTDRRCEGIWIGPPPKLLSENDLLFGDVLFCGGALRDKITSIIQKLSDGPYTHCGVYFGNGEVIDVATSGIRKIKLEEFISNYEYVTVTRCPGLNTSNKRLYNERMEKIENFVLRCIKDNVKYDFKNAALSPLKEFKNIKLRYEIGGSDKKESSHQELRQYFCSQFVLACFKATGWIDEDSSYFEPKFWTPTGLAEENIFNFIGFMSENGLGSVSRLDPFLGGNPWVLTDEGQEKLNQREIKLEQELLKLHDKQFKHDK